MWAYSAISITYILDKKINGLSVKNERTYWDLRVSKANRRKTRGENITIGSKMGKEF